MELDYVNIKCVSQQWINNPGEINCTECKYLVYIGVIVAQWQSELTTGGAIDDIKWIDIKLWGQYVWNVI